MKRIILALVMAICMAVAVWASCPITVKCPEDGLDAYYKGIRYSASGRCLCQYSHQWGGQTHNVVVECD